MRTFILNPVYQDICHISATSWLWPSAKGHGDLDLTMNNMTTRLRTQECLSWSSSSWVSLWLSDSLVTNLVTNIGDPWFFRCFCCQIALARPQWVTKKTLPRNHSRNFPQKHPGVFFLTDHFQPTTKPARKQKKPVKSFPKRVKCLVKLKIGKVVGFPSKGWYLFFPSEIKFGCGPLSVTVANEGGSPYLKM